MAQRDFGDWTGLPQRDTITPELLDDVEDAGDGIPGLQKIIGNNIRARTGNYIISGCTQSGANLTPGWAMINGSIVEFLGGALTGFEDKFYVFISENGSLVITDSPTTTRRSSGSVPVLYKDGSTIYNIAPRILNSVDDDYLDVASFVSKRIVDGKLAIRGMEDLSIDAILIDKTGITMGTAFLSELGINLNSKLNIIEDEIDFTNFAITNDAGICVIDGAEVHVKPGSDTPYLVLKNSGSTLQAYPDVDETGLLGSATNKWNIIYSKEGQFSLLATPDIISTIVRTGVTSGSRIGTVSIPYANGYFSALTTGTLVASGNITAASATISALNISAPSITTQSLLNGGNPISVGNGDLLGGFTNLPLPATATSPIRKMDRQFSYLKPDIGLTQGAYGGQSNGWYMYANENGQYIGSSSTATAWMNYGGIIPMDFKPTNKNIIVVQPGRPSYTWIVRGPYVPTTPHCPLLLNGFSGSFDAMLADPLVTAGCKIGRAHV